MSKMRSPNYPASALDDAVESIEKLWKKEHGTRVPHDVAAQDIGFKSLSGPARSRLAALKQYGLIEGRGDVAVTELAKRILIPKNPGERQAAIREAALVPDLFRTIHDSREMASDDAITAYLVREMGFSPIGARAFITAYRKTVAYARLSEQGTEGEQESSEGANMESLATYRSHESGPDRGGRVGAVRSFSWPLSADVTAEVRILGADKLSKAHFESLKDYLELAVKMIPDAAEEPEET